MIENGKRLVLKIDGVDTTVGLVEILGRTRLAYLPQTPFRYKPGEKLDIENVSYTVIESGQSEQVPKMVSLVILETPHG